MIQADALVTDVEQSGPFTRVILAAPTIASGLTPGRFVLADLNGYLRTPLFPASLDAPSLDAPSLDAPSLNTPMLEAGSCEVLVPPEHPAAALRPGTSVNLIGPLGQGFEVPTPARRLLLVADTAHLPVLLPLTRQKPSETRFFPKDSVSLSVALLLSAPTAARLYPIRLLPPALEVHVVTADGSAGHHGSILELFPDLVRWADCTCIAADPAIYPGLAEIVREVRIGPGHRFAQALVVPPNAFRRADAFRCAMACGVGACQGCAVEVARGTKLACTDGPVFNLLELR